MQADLLELCGYQADEIERDKARVDRAFELLRIGPKEIEGAEKRLHTQYDMSLQGVRKCLRVWMSELLDMVLAREEGKKIIYTGPPAYPVEPEQAIMLAAPEGVFVGYPSFILGTALGTIFGRADDLIEAAEESGLPPGFAHCSMTQTLLGAISRGYIPVPDLYISKAYACDQSSEADDMIQEIYEFPEIVYVDGCIDGQWDEWPNTQERRVKFLSAQMRAVLGRVQEAIGVAVTDEHIEAARGVLIQNFMLLWELFALLRNDPPPISMGDVMPLYYMGLNPVRDRGPFVDAFTTLTREGKERIETGFGVVPKGSPKILLTMAANVDNGVTHIIEESGLSPITLYFMHPMEAQMAPSDYTDPLDCIAETYFRMPLFAGIPPNLQWVREVAQGCGISGVIWHWIYCCRYYTGTSPIAIRNSLTEELGLPTLVLEGDYHCARDYSGEAARTRIEAFAEVVKTYSAARQR
jgi:benzoyl-CoA reductase/2-hydroxyglutaryl-CoA dehydratase subunit BcrC/BadD/HgdB